MAGGGLSWSQVGIGPRIWAKAGLGDVVMRGWVEGCGVLWRKIIRLQRWRRAEKSVVMRWWRDSFRWRSCWGGAVLLCQEDLNMGWGSGSMGTGVVMMMMMSRNTLMYETVHVIIFFAKKSNSSRVQMSEYVQVLRMVVQHRFSQKLTFRKVKQSKTFPEILAKPTTKVDNPPKSRILAKNLHWYGSSLKQPELWVGVHQGISNRPFDGEIFDYPE